MFTEETREKLLKEIVRREVRDQQGVELEDLLNPIKVSALLSPPSVNSIKFPKVSKSSKAQPPPLGNRGLTARSHSSLSS
jgi:hypothetical protein